MVTLSDFRGMLSCFPRVVLFHTPLAMQLSTTIHPSLTHLFVCVCAHVCMHLRVPMYMYPRDWYPTLGEIQVLKTPRLLFGVWARAE